MPPYSHKQDQEEATSILTPGDRPIRVGDFCRYGEQLGAIEAIGLRSTRIRSLERTLVSVPNAEFSNMLLENYAKRDQHLMCFTLGLRYETTAEQLRFVLAELRKLLLAHPQVAADKARARLVNLATYSLDVEVFAHIRTKDWNEFLAIREDLLLRMIDLIKEAGTGFAFPSQTAYLSRDQGLDKTRTEAAETKVEAWREARILPFPDFTDDYRWELKDKLDYPPEGSPDSPNNRSDNDA